VGTGTLAETIAAVAVEAVLALLVATATAATIVTTGTMTERASSAAELARFELVITDACARVLQPPEARSPVTTLTRTPKTAPISTSPDAPDPSSPAYAWRVEVEHVDGQPDRRLVLVADRAHARLSVAGAEHRFPSLRIERIAVERAPVPHLSMTVRAGQSRAYEVRAPFGSFPPP